jgi:hypothetical protein
VNLDVSDRYFERDRLVRPEGAALLGDLVAFLRRFVVMSDAQAAAVALWVVHTHAIEASDVTPYLAIGSAEKRSGKSRLLELLALLVARPLATANISDAALFRAIAEHSPTLLFDEVDAIFGAKAREREDLRGLLNAGYRRGNFVYRMGGPKMSVLESFEVYCAKALAGIGGLPDTIADRSIAITLKRRAPGEHVERYRRRETESEAAELRDRIAFWTGQNLAALIDARPSLPVELDDRAQDGWEPLFAIADLAGAEWPEYARSAALALSAGEERDEDSTGVRLLADTRGVFHGRGVDRLSANDLCAALASDEEAPWVSWRGAAITPRGLAGLLRPYGIRSRTIRLADGSTPKGYPRELFADAWARYLPSTGALSATPPQPAPLSDKPLVSIRHTNGLVADRGEDANPHQYSDVADVADTRAFQQDEDQSAQAALFDGDMR